MDTLVNVFYTQSIKYHNKEIEEMEGVGSSKSLFIISLFHFIVLLQIIFPTMPQNSFLWQNTLQTLLKGFSKENIKELCKEDV